MNLVKNCWNAQLSWHSRLGVLCARYELEKRTIKILRAQKNANFIPDYSAYSLRRDELIALKRLVQALRDAGLYSQGAYAACLLLNLVPKELLSDPEFVNIGSYVGAMIRDVGLEVPAPFKRSRDENRRHSFVSSALNLDTSRGSE